MVTLTITICDECRKEARRLIEIGHGMYCSRDCYLAACKRLFDLHWIQALKSSQSTETFRKTKAGVSKVA